MTAAVVFTLAALPIYLLLREPFRGLPLHVDTGFYVSNHTIATGRWDYRRGWNAHFAGASKVLPEAFFTGLYLLARWLSRDRLKTAARFVSWSRLGVSLVNYLSALLVGVLAMLLADGDARCYYAGLVCYALLSSEPHFGGYFECAEVFEIPAQLLAVIALTLGLDAHAPSWIALAAFLLAAEAVFIKLSSMITFAALCALLGAWHPWAIVPAGAGGAVAAALYALWLMYLGRGPADWLAPLRGHETHYARRGRGWGLADRLREKAGALIFTVARQPAIPLLALSGMIGCSGGDGILPAYLLAVTATWLGQGTDCRYYMLPVLAPVAVYAALSAVTLLGLGVPGLLLLTAAAAVWFAGTPLRAVRQDRASRNRWVWRGSRTAAQADENEQLAGLAAELDRQVNGGSLLVYGPHNQAYLLLGASYPTLMVAPEYYLDDVCPGWQARLNAQMIETPPACILDTARCFDPVEARRGLGLCFEPVLTAGVFRLYRLVARAQPSPGPAPVTTFRPLSAAEWSAAGRTAGVDKRTAPPANPAPANDEQAAELQELLLGLAAAGCRGIALYGAGRFTVRHADGFRASPVPVRVVLDDHATEGREARFLDWPLVPPQRVSDYPVDAVILSTDRFASAMRRRLRRLGLRRLPAYAIAGRHGAATDRATAAYSSDRSMNPVST